MRQNPTTVSNVVTYTAVVYVSNTDGALLPGMTANATIQVAHVDNATHRSARRVYLHASDRRVRPHASRPRVRRAARRRSPHRRTPRPRAQRNGATSASPWGSTGASSGGAVTPGATGRIFVLRGGKLQPVPVKVGLVGETQASVTPLRGTLSATDSVVTGDNRSGGSAASHAARAGNPLAGTQRGFGGGGGRAAGRVTR